MPATPVSKLASATAPTVVDAPPAAPGQDTSGYAVASMALGLCGLALNCLMLLFGYVCGITGLVFAILSLNSHKRGVAVTGLVINIVLLVLTLALNILFALGMLGIIDIPGLDLTYPEGWPFRIS
jgi:hypothetical protein